MNSPKLTTVTAAVALDNPSSMTIGGLDSLSPSGATINYDIHHHVDMRDMKTYEELRAYLKRMPFNDRLEYLSGQVDMSFTGKKLKLFTR